jgi:hypothetical protein
MRLFAATIRHRVVKKPRTTPDRAATKTLKPRDLAHVTGGAFPFIQCAVVAPTPSTD